MATRSTDMEAKATEAARKYAEGFTEGYVDFETFLAGVEWGHREGVKSALHLSTVRALMNEGMEEAAKVIGHFDHNHSDHCNALCHIDDERAIQEKIK